MCTQSGNEQFSKRYDLQDFVDESQVSFPKYRYKFFLDDYFKLPIFPILNEMTINIVNKVLRKSLIINPVSKIGNRQKVSFLAAARTYLFALPLAQLQYKWAVPSIRAYD